MAGRLPDDVLRRHLGEELDAVCGVALVLHTGAAVLGREVRRKGGLGHRARSERGVCKGKTSELRCDEHAREPSSHSDRLGFL